MQNPDNRLDLAMDARRLSLNLEWRDLAKAAGVSYETLRALRRAGNAAPLTKRRVEEALRWKPGSVDAVLAGGQPTPVRPEPESRYDRDELNKLLAEMDRILARIREIQQREK